MKTDRRKNMIFENPKVLVCDDQPMLRALLTNAINDYSPKYEVVQAENGLQAENLIRNEDFRFVFLDVEMPEQDGFTTLQHVREENLAKGTPIVMCTGCSEEEDLVRGWQLRADYYLTKPFDLEEIDALLKEIEEKQAAVA
jgi:twitching motility two-component system response regulator PilH